MDHSERAQEQPAARHHATPPARTADLRGPEQLLLALQAHAGNRAVQRIVAGSGPPRTPVVQRATGLAADVGGFVGRLAEVFRSWDSPQGDPDTRRKALYTAINDQLHRLDVPKVDLYPGLPGTGGAVLGIFKPDLWVMGISSDLLRAPTLNKTERAELADTVIHESRHAEQFFRVARLLCIRERKSDAGKKKDARRDSKTIAAAVAARLDMNVSVVTGAQQQGGDLGKAEAAEAELWSQHIPLNTAVHEKMETAKKAWNQCLQDIGKFQHDFAAAPKRPDLAHMPVNSTQFQDRFQELEKRFEQTFAEYGKTYRDYQVGLSFEADAWQTGQAAHDAVAQQKPPGLDAKLATLREPWDRLLESWRKRLYTAPPRPQRDLSAVQPLVQRHAIPAELEPLPEGIEPAP